MDVDGDNKPASLFCWSGSSDSTNPSRSETGSESTNMKQIEVQSLQSKSRTTTGEVLWCRTLALCNGEVERCGDTDLGAGSREVRGAASGF